MVSIDGLAEFERIFHPQSVAVVGASTDVNKFGGRFLSSLLAFGFKGKVYPVNPNASEILGLKAYRSVADIPEPVDMACISVPAKAVPQAMRECAAKGVTVAAIFTAGFSELGDGKGRQLEEEVAAIGREGGVRIVGPNCFGIYCPAGGLTLLPGYDYPTETGPVAFISQSGGFANFFARLAKGSGIRFSKVVSYGNACDINEADLLEYLIADPETEIITAYIEGVRDGRRFTELVAKASETKPVIIWKAGLTGAGSKAVASHTASLAGTEAVWNAFFRKTGAVRVNGLEELMDTTIAFLHLGHDVGGAVGILGGGGGISVSAADDCERSGLMVPTLSPDTQRTLRTILPPAGNSVLNPVDFGAPVVPAPILRGVLETVASDENVETLIVVLITYYLLFFGRFGSNADEFTEIPVAVRDKYSKPVIMVLPEVGTEVEAAEVETDRRRVRDYYLSAGIPAFPTLQRAAKALGNFLQYRSRKLPRPAF